MKILPHRQQGFTLVEALAVTAISGLLAVASTPLIEGFQQQRATTALQTRLETAFASAREAAVSGGRPVTVCASEDGQQCKGTDWSSGWLVFQTDPSANASRLVIENYRLEDGAGEIKVIDERLELAGHIEFNPRGFVAQDKQYVATLCKDKMADTSALVIERSGRLRNDERWLERYARQAESDSSDLHQSVCKS